MIRKVEIVKGSREYTMPLTPNTEYYVSGSGAFTILVLDGSSEVLGVCVNEGYVRLPKFSRTCQLKIVGRDWSAFTVYVSDSRLTGE